MVFGKGIKNPKALIVMAMSSLVVGLNMQYAFRSSSHLSMDWRDGLSGFFIGVSIALNIGYVILTRRRRKSTKSC